MQKAGIVCSNIGCRIVLEVVPLTKCFRAKVKWRVIALCYEKKTLVASSKVSAYEIYLRTGNRLHLNNNRGPENCLHIMLVARSGLLHKHDKVLGQFGFVTDFRESVVDMRSRFLIIAVIWRMMTSFVGTLP